MINWSQISVSLSLSPNPCELSALNLHSLPYSCQKFFNTSASSGKYVHHTMKFSFFFMDCVQVFFLFPVIPGWNILSNRHSEKYREKTQQSLLQFFWMNINNSEKQSSYTRHSFFTWQLSLFDWNRWYLSNKLQLRL